MDMLNTLEKKSLPTEDSVTNYFRQTVEETTPFQESYQNAPDQFTSLNEFTVSGEIELSSTRHSSGCDDSGVFLEDLPYTPENNTSVNTSDSKLKQTSPQISRSKVLLSPEMRQYSIDTQGALDSDAEKSDDLGLASSSIDSADDLDGDPLPSTLMPEPPPIPSKKKPPPVPSRKSLSNNKNNEIKKTMLNFITTESQPVNTKRTEITMLLENLNSTPNEIKQVTGHKDSYKWKSEECLRTALENKWSLKHNEKSISVKDRIAMFSEMETSKNQNKKDEPPLQRYGSENNVKIIPSVETANNNHESQDQDNMKYSEFPTLSKDAKWYSMYNIPPTAAPSFSNAEYNSSNIKSAVSIPSLTSSNVKEADSIKSSNNSSSTNPLKVETEYRYFEKPIISNYPQTQLVNNRRYSYNSLKPIRTTEDLLNRRNSGGGLLSIIDSRKQPLAKFKGLVIPDKPLQSPNSKTLPTIFSSDSVITTAKTDMDIDKDWKKSFISSTPASYKTMSLPRTKNEIRSKIESSVEQEINMSKLEDPPWKSGVSNGSSNNTLPKYSPAFKKRSLELPHALGSSLSPTPPSSITSPLSPPPSSPSSICSSNASSTSVATLQQNVFQFSLSHSKPVTPVLPEKPIMSPPSLLSDVEYEGDNSEDSSTSASPMMSQNFVRLISSPVKQSSLCSSSPLHPKRPMYLKSEVTSSVVQTLSFQSHNDDQNKSFLMRTSKSLYHSDSDSSNKCETSKAFISLQTFSKHVDEERSDAKITKNNKVTHDITTLHDCSTTNFDSKLQITPKNEIEENDNRLAENRTIPSTTTEINDVTSGDKNFFAEIQTDVPVGKFHAQPLKVGETVSTNDIQSGFRNDKNLFVKECYSKNGNIQNGFNGNEDKPENNASENIYAREKDWFQSADLLRYKEKNIESDDDDDDCRSSISHRTEESRQTTDDYLSDATTDSFDKSLDPDLRPRRLSQQRTVLKAAADCTDSVQKFRALAEKWEQKADTKSPPPSIISNRSKSKKDNKPSSSFSSSSFISSLINNNTSSTFSNSSSLKLPPSLMPRQQQFMDSTRSLDRKTKTSFPNGTSNSVRRNIISQKESTAFQNSKNTRNSYETLWYDKASNSNDLSNKIIKSEYSSAINNSILCNNNKNLNEDEKNLNDCQNHLLTNDQIHEKNTQNCTNGISLLNWTCSQSKDDDVFSPVTLNISVNNKEKKECSYSRDVSNRPTDNLQINTETNIIKDHLVNENKILIPPGNGNLHATEHQSSNETENKEEPVSTKKSYGKEYEKLESLNNTSYIRKRASSENKDLMDNLWSDNSRDSSSRKPFIGDQKKEFLANRNMSKSQITLSNVEKDLIGNVRCRPGSYFSSNKAKSVSVSDIRKAFESQSNQNNTNLTSKPPVPPPRASGNGAQKQIDTPAKLPSTMADHKRLSSIDSTASGDSDLTPPSRHGSFGSLAAAVSRDSYGSVTSLASTTSLISPQELQQLIDEANQSLEESCGTSFHQQEIQVIILHREVPAGSIGITLAGGADYEVKEITVHKVIAGSLADRDGRIRKGDRVISINGKNLKGITHREALDILKAPRPEVVLVISREKSETNGLEHKQHECDEAKSNQEQIVTRIKENGRRKSDDAGIVLNSSSDTPKTSQIVCVELQRDGTGLGFSIEGGKDSPLGDRPILIKRVFKGGAADKEGQLEVGDEILSVNGQSVTHMTRTEAWNFMKKLPDEPVVLKARKAVFCSS